MSFLRRAVTDGPVNCHAAAFYDLPLESDALFFWGSFCICPGCLLGGIKICLGCCLQVHPPMLAFQIVRNVDDELLAICRTRD